jgi:6-phosphofructokinase 2
MADILTITLNPAVDVATTTARIAPEHKLRCTPERRDPGGGGINAARVIHRLGGDVLAALVAGGPIGQLLQSLLAQEGLPALVIPASGDTRESFTIIETDTGREYRFVLPGPLMPERERDAAIAALTPSLMSARFVVCGGSLPPGAPDDTYAALADIARRGGGKFALDASGAALQAALAKRVYLVKPSLRELQDLCGRPLQDSAAILRAARDLIESAQAEIVAVTLGARGALVVTQTQTWRRCAAGARRKLRRRRR